MTANQYGIWKAGYVEADIMVQYLREAMMDEDIDFDGINDMTIRYIHRPPVNDTEGNPLESFTAIKVTYNEAS